MLCYVDRFRIERARMEIDFERMVVPFELRPPRSLDGVPPGAFMGGGHSKHVEAHLIRVSQAEGFPLVFPESVPSTHLAHTLAELARDRGAEAHEAVHAGIFDAHFGKGLDIGQESVLLAVAGSAGLPAREVERAWRQDAYAERLRRYRSFALSLGVTATPALLICNELLIGSRPVAALRDALERCRVRVREIAERVESTAP